MYYQYKTKILKVYDGDTCTASLDCGLNITCTLVLRLLGIDTPEIRGKTKEQGIKVRNFVRRRILNKQVEIETEKQGKYGRYLAIVHYFDKKGSLINLNQELIDKGFAKPYFGGKR